MRAHPAGNHIGVGRRALWYGKEVEGSISAHAAETVFIDSIPDEAQLAKLQAAFAENKIWHVFLTEYFDAWEWFVQTFWDMIPVSVMGVTVAREADEAQIKHVLALPMAEGLHLVVRASTTASWLHLLRKDDEVSVGVPYDLVTFMLSKGVRTTPQQFEGDRDEP